MSRKPKTQTTKHSLKSFILVKATASAGGGRLRAVGVVRLQGTGCSEEQQP